MNNANTYAATQSKGLSITALILGLLSLLFGFFTAIPGIIVGHIARSKAKKNPQQYGGSGMALTGLIISYAVLILTAVMIYMFATNPDIKEMFTQMMEQVQQVQQQLPATQ